MEHRFRRVAHEAKVSALVHELGDPKRGLTLVFVRTKRGADRLVKRLGAHDVRAVAMHGDKSQSQREKALSRFEAGHVKTLVATDVAARGIDVAGITHVINYDAPEAREDYVHRTGRTARAGASGVGITFVLDDQARDVAKLAGELGLDHGLGVEVRQPSRPERQRPAGGGRSPTARAAARAAGGSSPPGSGTPRPADRRSRHASHPGASGFGFGRTTRTVRPELPSRPSGPRAETRTRKRPRDGGVQRRSWPPRPSRMSRASTSPRGPNTRTRTAEPFESVKCSGALRRARSPRSGAIPIRGGSVS